MRVLSVFLIALAVAPALRAQTPSAPLQALFEEEWQFRLRENPLFATDAGDHRYDALLPSMTPEDLARRACRRRSARA